jgi:hypothetical protein
VDACLEACLDSEPALVVLEGIGLGGGAAPMHMSVEASGETGSFPATFRIPPVERRVLSVSARAPHAALELFSCSGTTASRRTLAVCRAGPEDTAALEHLDPPDEELFVRVRNRATLDDPCLTPAGGPVSLQAGSRDLNPADLLAKETEVAFETQGAIAEFSVALDGLVHFTARATPLETGQPYLSLREPDGSRVLTRSVDGRLTWVSPSSGDLLLVLKDSLGGDGDMLLFVDTHPLEGQVISGTLEPGEVDYLAVDLLLGTELLVNTWPGAADSTPDTVLHLEDSRGRTLATNDDRGGDLLAALPTYAARRDETLYIRVEMRGEEAQDYLLQIQVEPAPPDLLLTPTTGDLLVNEVLVDPGGMDISGDGVSSAGDQFVEMVNLTPYSLDLSGLVVWSRADYLALPDGARVGPRQAFLLFNGAADPALFDVQVFSAGCEIPWLSTGADALTVTVEGSFEPLETLFVPATAPGESANRVVEADPDQILRPHSGVVDSTGLNSPGRRADGGSWR